MANNQLLINYEPSTLVKIEWNKRFLVSENQLKNYVGEINANKAVLRHLKSGMDKTIIKLRKYGKLEIYNK